MKCSWIALIAFSSLLWAFEPANKAGVHPEQLHVISLAENETITYRACQPGKEEWNCFQIDPGAMELCTHHDGSWHCKSPTNTNAVDILDTVIKPDADGPE